MAFGGIGMSLGDQLFHHRDHFRNVISRMRIDIRPGDANGGHVGEIDLFEFLGNDADLDALFLCRRVYLVVDVGDIACVDDIRPKVAQQPDQHVEDDGGTRIADMGVGIDGGSTHIHCHPVGIDRNELFFVAGQRIIKVQRHGAENISAGDRL